MGWVQSSRWLDSGCLACFLMCVSAASLHLFSHLWNVCQRPELAQWKVGRLLKTLFHINRSFEFNLTHVLLMSIIICLLSLRPDYELQATVDAKKKKKSSTVKADAPSSESG